MELEGDRNNYKVVTCHAYWFPSSLDPIHTSRSMPVPHTHRSVDTSSRDVASMPTVTLKSILRTSQQRSTCWSFNCLCSSSAERSVRSSTSIRYVNPWSSWRSLGLTLSTDASSQHGHTDTHTHCESMDTQTDIHASTIAKNHIKRLNVHQLLCRYGVYGCKTVIELLRSPRRCSYLEWPTSSGVHSVYCRSACELTLSLLHHFNRSCDLLTLLLLCFMQRYVESPLNFQTTVGLLKLLSLDYNVVKTAWF